jgi:2-polyprenyl-3-methyl-5-hydroxy-6-metoxy-1,4-benzoquinol methylase
MGTQSHWEHVYEVNASDAVSWYRPHLDTSLSLIQRVASDPSAAIIDVGGGASTLVDDLLHRGYQNLTVLDISPKAIDLACRRLGEDAEKVHWLTGSITEIALQPGAYDVWHDRALFHFLTQPEQRTAYLAQLMQALKTGGHAIIATFGPRGPLNCSGLDVLRYDIETLQRELGQRFHLKQGIIEEHKTPHGAVQQFLYCIFQLH